MDIPNNKDNKTATHGEQQPKTKQEIVEDIIKILADNNLSIMDSRDILHATSKTICKQAVRISL